MKKIFYSLLVALAAISCKKEDEGSPIGGFWAGTAVPKGTTITEFVGFLYKDDGTVRGYASNPDTSLADKLDGTYTIDPDSVRTILVNGLETTEFTSDLNDASTQMYGTFRRSNGTFSGTYSVTKR